MKLATWNVNSLKVRLPQLLEWLGRERPDVVCLQEIKLEDSKFPKEEIRAAGYEAVYAGQKTYNGVAILCPVPPTEVACGIPGFDHPGTELFNDIARSDDEALRWEVVGRGASFATDFDYRS